MSAAPKIQGWCPGALRPMQSGDGLLLRAKTLQPRLSAAQAREIAAIARECGNGLIDLSQRAQLQLRGIDAARLDEAQRRLASIGLLAKDAATESVLNFLVSPFAGACAEALVACLADALATDTMLQTLPGKFGFLIDDGDALGLADLSMDVRLEAYGSQVAVIADGARAQAFVVERERVVETTLALARAFLALRSNREFELRRMRGVIGAFGLDALAKEAGLTPAPYRSSCRAASAAEIFGVHERSEGGAYVGVGAPSGRLRADDLAALAQLAETKGFGELRLTPWRAVILPCAREASARAMIDVAESRELIVAADDPRLAVIACSGAPECPQALAPTRNLAARLAPLAARLARGSAALHISGCAKGCASPLAAKITLVATTRGFDLVDEGRAADEPTLRGLDVNEIAPALEARVSMTEEAR